MRFFVAALFIFLRDVLRRCYYEVDNRAWVVVVSIRLYVIPHANGVLMRDLRFRIAALGRVVRARDQRVRGSIVTNAIAIGRIVARNDLRAKDCGMTTLCVAARMVMYLVCFLAVNRTRVRVMYFNTRVRFVLWRNGFRSRANVVNAFVLAFRVS